MGRKTEPECRHVDVMCTECAAVLTGEQLRRLQTTIREMKRLGRLDSPMDAARVAVALGLARSVDWFPDNAALWKQYRDALRELTHDDSSTADTADDLFREVRDSAPSGPSDVRRGDHPDR